MVENGAAVALGLVVQFVNQHQGLRTLLQVYPHGGAVSPVGPDILAALGEDDTTGLLAVCPEHTADTLVSRHRAAVSVGIAEVYCVFAIGGDIDIDVDLGVESGGDFNGSAAAISFAFVEGGGGGILCHVEGSAVFQVKVGEGFAGKTLVAFFVHGNHLVFGIAVLVGDVIEIGACQAFGLDGNGASVAQHFVFLGSGGLLPCHARGAVEPSPWRFGCEHGRQEGVVVVV